MFRFVKSAVVMEQVRGGGNEGLWGVCEHVCGGLLWLGRWQSDVVGIGVVVVEGEVLVVVWEHGGRRRRPGEGQTRSKL